MAVVFETDLLVKEKTYMYCLNDEYDVRKFVIIHLLNLIFGF